MSEMSCNAEALCWMRCDAMHLVSLVFDFYRTFGRENLF